MFPGRAWLCAPLLLGGLSLACGSDEAASSADREPAAASEEAPRSSGSLARLIDPSGFSEVVARQDHGDRTFALVQRDVIGAGWAEVASTPHSGAFTAAFDTLLAACLSAPNPVRCAAELSPNIGTLAATTGESGTSWSVAVVQDDAVIASRPLVALSLHQNDGALLAQPSLELQNLDADPRQELIVEIPLHALRDDLLLDDRDEERGAVTYVLDERLNVQARWTSMWLVVYGDPEAEPANDACTVTYRAHEGGLLFRSVCNDEDEETLTCAYAAEDDRFDCPATFADQLFRPYVSMSSHYVGEDEDALRAALPGFGSRVQEVLRLAAVMHEAATAPPSE